jgi:hypothetical protein
VYDFQGTDECASIPAAKNQHGVNQHLILSLETSNFLDRFRQRAQLSVCRRRPRGFGVFEAGGTTCIDHGSCVRAEPSSYRDGS